MLPTDIYKIIFMYCDSDFYDNILKSNDTILINYLTALGLHKIIEHYHNGSPCNFCMLNYKNICDWNTKFYIKRYTFRNGPIIPHKYGPMKKYIPFNEKHFEFKCRQSNKMCDETTAELFYKSDYDIHVSIKKNSYWWKNFEKYYCTDDSDDESTIHPITTPSQIFYSFRLHPEEHQPSGTVAPWTRYDTCSSCSDYEKTKKI